MNRVCLVGRILEIPRKVETESTECTKGYLHIPQKWIDKHGELRHKTIKVPLIAWGHQAHLLALISGDKLNKPVSIEGALNSSNYINKYGDIVSSLSVTVLNIEQIDS